MELYVNRSIDRRWRQELGRAATAPKVFSPFITSTTAESVTAQLDGRASEIHTVFKIELFAMGSSSLATLKKLIDQGHSLYHVERLHAKIVLVPGEFASLGSQNLTRGGIKNKEASAALTDARDVKLVEKSVQPWIEARTPITPQMIADMENLLPEVMRLYQVAQVAAVEADVKLHHLQIAREEKARAEKQLQEEYELALLRRALDTAPTSSSLAFARVKDVTKSDSFRQTISLVVDGKFDLASWWIEGRHIELNARTRYLCINEDNGRIGWARLVHTRITFIANQLVIGETEIAGRPCSLHLRTIWSRRRGNSGNATVEVSTVSKQRVCDVRIGFGTQGIEVIKVSPVSRKKNLPPEVSEWTEWINNNGATFAESTLSRFTSPFVYKGRLYGNKADVFFGPIGRVFRVRAVIIKGQPVIACKSLR